MRTNLGTKNGNPETDAARRLDRLERIVQQIPSRFGSAQSTGDSVSINFKQVAHGFSVGSAIALNGTNFVAAKADSSATSGFFGIVSAIIDSNNFTVVVAGKIKGLAGLTAASLYYLSDSSAGQWTVTPPIDGHYYVPVFYSDPTDATIAYVIPGRFLGSTINMLTGGRLYLGFNNTNVVDIKDADFTTLGLTGKLVKVNQYDVCDPATGTIKKAVFLATDPF